jgi:hypothetical protein
MKYLLTLCFAAFLLPAFSQVKCYTGNVQMMTDLRYRIDANNQLYLQTSTFNEVEYYFLSGSVIYFGRRGDLSNPVYTIKDEIIYKGNSTMIGDQLFRISDNGIYPGNSTTSFDCLYTIEEGKVYRGTSKSSFDVLLSCDKTELTEAELYLLIAAILPY